MLEHNLSLHVTGLQTYSNGNSIFVPYIYSLHSSNLAPSFLGTNYENREEIGARESKSGQMQDSKGSSCWKKRGTEHRAQEYVPTSVQNRPYCRKVGI